MDAADLLDAIRQTYARCSTYRDTGDVVTVLNHDVLPPRCRTTSQPFATWFVRPDRFRFDSTSPKFGLSGERTQEVIWERHGVARSWRRTRGERAGNLSHLLAGAIGACGSVSTTIPRLLMPEHLSRGRVFPVEAMANESLGSKQCHKVRFSWGAVGSETWWVDTGSLLLQQVYQEIDFSADETREMLGRAAEVMRQPADPHPSFRTQTTTTYAGFVNQPIDDEAFDFVPPA